MTTTSTTRPGVSGAILAATLTVLNLSLLLAPAYARAQASLAAEDIIDEVPVMIAAFANRSRLFGTHTVPSSGTTCPTGRGSSSGP